MKLSVSAFRAQASAQRKILSSYQSQLNYGACTSFPALGGYKLEDKSQMMVDTTGIKSNERTTSPEKPKTAQDSEMLAMKRSEKGEDNAAANSEKREETTLTSDKSPARSRSKSNQRWMKLRTTVQLSGAISSTSQKSKPQLKREDSFLKRFSTRQIPEAQETVDTGDETETQNGSQTQNEINRRRRKKRKEMSKTVVNPDENFYFYWLMTVTVCVLYNLWTLIVRQSFPELQKAAAAFWYSGDGFTDVVFVCDIVVQFRTGYLEQGLMVYDSKKLACHYLKSRAFIFDVLSLLPLDFLQLNIGVNPMLRFPRFFKIYRVYSYYYMVESRTVYPNLWRVVNLIHILLILAHWFGCFYYLLSEAEGFQGDWVYPYRPGDYATLTRKYLGSLYWSTLTLTTIGDLPTPETNAESRGRSKAITTAGQTEGIPRRGHKSRLLQFNSNYGYVFTIISYLIGVFIFATIVGQVGNVITNRNANRLEFERLLDGAKTYMRHHKVPGGMKRRVLRWYDYSWSRGRIQGGGDINTALGLLPDKLKTELALHVNLSVLKKVTIFQECQPEFLHDLVLKMKAYIFTPGDLICRKGEVAREMFIIADGILDVISETGRVLTTMKAGDFFGEIGILNLDGLNKRTADVRSVGYSELFSLSREDVLTAMKDYPEAQEILQSLGRKRLMEAKNASKMFRVQAKQPKDHDSSGDSDSAGKRIVEKLRSDVKGLKNALRRSRRETRTTEAVKKSLENRGGKTSNNRHSILRRMSHVQSSDEYEVNNDVEHSKVGAGLPLLQRLKLLKEKEREEREKCKLIIPNESQSKKDENVDGETPDVDLPFTLKLNSLKQKDGKESTAAGSVSVSATVRTQLTGVRFDKSIFKCKNTDSFKEAEEKVLGDSGTTANEEDGESGLKKKESIGNQRISPKEKLKTAHSNEVKDRILALPETPEKAEIISNSNFAPETRIETKKSDYSMPKLVRKKFEVPKTKDAWKLLKNSSLTCSKPERQVKNEINKTLMKVTNKGTYLSKSDTILEKQKSWEREEDKRSRSVSPSSILKSQRKDTKQNGSDEMGERGRAIFMGHPSKVEENVGSVTGFEVANLLNSTICCSTDSNEGRRRKVKKYNSISDLSPEYSGLPFVKKLKILNERQKLEELEKELLVRSVSLDAPERPTRKREGILARSHSDANTDSANATGFENPPNLRIPLQTYEKCLAIHNDSFVSGSKPYFKCRKETDLESNAGSQLFSGGCLDSPESNETLERKHLKSILKKLSVEGRTNDKNQVLRNSKVISTTKREDNAEFKKLMRAPTLEGYAARHKKLMKSVTFDNEPPLSPSDVVVLEQTLGEGEEKSFSPVSPAAVLTLQLSNLSMIPIAGPNATDEIVEQKKIKKPDKVDHEESIEMKKPKATFQAEAQKFQISNEDGYPLGDFLMPHALQGLIEKSLRDLTLYKNLDDDSFSEIKVGICRVLEEFLEGTQQKLETQFCNLQFEIEKRDEIILQLHSRIQELEQYTSFSGIQDVCLSPARLLKHSAIAAENCDTVEEEELIIGSQKNDYNVSHQDPCALSLNYLNSPINYEDRSPLEEKIYLLQTAENSRDHPKGFEGALKITSIEELELEEVPKLFQSNHFKGKTMEFDLIQNFSIDGIEPEGIPKSENSTCEIIKCENDEKLESRPKGSFLNRMTKIPRTFNRSQGKTADFIALDIDDSSNSSDTEYLHNKNWEVQMLVEELEKENRDWETEKEIYNSGKGLEHQDNVKDLQQEVDRLKKMVCAGNLTTLTSSELDILETIIEAKDQKILELEKSKSLDTNDKSKIVKKQLPHCRLGSDDKVKTCVGWRRKPSLRQKIGHALSFDFHDIERQKSHDRANLRTSTLRKQETVSYSPKDHQSVYNLWHTSSRLRNRVLENSRQTTKNLPIQSSEETRAVSSLPILIPSCLSRENFNEVSASLPIIPVKEPRTNFNELSQTSQNLSTECSRPYHGSHEETQQGNDFKQNQDPFLDGSKPLPKSTQKEARNHKAPLTNELIRSINSQSSSSLNNFIKSVGQKVKQVMTGEGSTVRNQVPTISKLCDERVTPKLAELGVSENLEVSGGGDEVVNTVENDQSKISDSYEKKSKTDPHNL